MNVSSGNGRMKEGCKKSKLFYAIQAFLISFACTVQFHKPLLLGAYEEKIDYLLAQAAELLGEYRFTAVLIFFWHMDSCYI